MVMIVEDLNVRARTRVECVRVEGWRGSRGGVAWRGVACMCLSARVNV